MLFAAGCSARLCEESIFRKDGRIKSLVYLAKKAGIRGFQTVWWVVRWLLSLRYLCLLRDDATACL
jgi:hypothetical protein